MSRGGPPLSDAQLFDFNASLMADYDDEKARADLETYGDAFRFQLVAALHISDMAERLADPDNPVYQDMEAHEIRGWVNALQHVAAYLRQGYYLPGGLLLLMGRLAPADHFVEEQPAYKPVP